MEVKISIGYVKVTIAISVFVYTKLSVYFILEYLVFM